MLPGGVAAPIRLPLLLLLLLLHCGRGAVQVRKVWWKAEALHSEHQLREATQVLLHVQHVKQSRVVFESLRRVLQHLEGRPDGQEALAAPRLVGVVEQRQPPELALQLVG